MITGQISASAYSALPGRQVQYLAAADTQKCALNIGSAYSVMKCIVLHRSWRLEKDNGFAEHIRLATGATHDTGCRLVVVEWGVEGASGKCRWSWR